MYFSSCAAVNYIKTCQPYDYNMENELQLYSRRYNIKYSLDTGLANQTAAKGVVMIVCRTEI